jgi:hypothetical protein
LGVLSYYEDIDEDVEDSMEKTSRNVEVAPDKFAILRSPETRNLLVTARCLMRLTLKPSFEFPGSVTPAHVGADWVRR